MIYVYKHSVYVCAFYTQVISHVVAKPLFCKASLMELCDLCCMGRYPEGDALTINAPWHADHWEKTC